MSGSARMLKKRFTEIRRRRGRAARLAAAVMAAVMAVSMLAATAAMAAVGSDGLEHWDKIELYYCGSMEFNVNVAGQNVPKWLTDEVAGAEGDVDIVISRYQARNLRGEVFYEHLLVLNGKNGSVEIAGNGWSALAEASSNTELMTDMHDTKSYPYYTEMIFCETPGQRNDLDFYPLYSLINCKEGNRDVRINFAVDADKEKIQAAYIAFQDAPDLSAQSVRKDFGIVKADKFAYIGNFEQDYLYMCGDSDTDNAYFTLYEDNFVNLPNENISIDISGAAAEGILLSTDITLPEAAYIHYDVYRDDGVKIAGRNYPASEKTHNITPNEGTEYQWADGKPIEKKYTIPENQFMPGCKYRVCVTVQDETYAVLYRWQEYVTVK